MGKVYIVISVQGCMPYFNIEQKNGEARVFKTEEKAQAWARKNCAWEWKVVEW
jgi:hypothetical protein